MNHTAPDDLTTAACGELIGCRYPPLLLQSRDNMDQAAILTDSGKIEQEDDMTLVVARAGGCRSYLMLHLRGNVTRGI